MFFEPAQQIAFIDEYGDASLATEKNAVTNYFIITAVLVDKKDLSVKEEVLRKIITKHFQIGEMKSSRVAGKTNRRKKILKELNDLDFHFYALVIDKRDIQKDSGLNFKKSFFKFLNGLAYRKLYSTFPNLKVVADEHGTTEFMRGFAAYVQKKHIPNLFDKAEFEFASSKKVPFVQVADFISGTIAREYEPDKSEESGCLGEIQNKAIIIDEWPPKWHAYKDTVRREKDNEIDHIIREQALNQARIFLERNEKNEDADFRMQVTTLKHLLFQYKFIDPSVFITTSRLIQHLENSNIKDVSEHALRSKVIAPLRDSGVIISSSSKGLKLPVGLSDMTDFADRTNSIIQPMLERLNKARDQILLASKNQIDILDNPRFDNLRYFLNKNKPNQSMQSDG